MPSNRQTVSRRDLLATGAATATAAVAGCSTIIDQIADQLLEDVNVFNETDRQVTGDIEVVTADGSTVLDASMTLDPPDDEDNGNPNLSTYADVWDGAGEYDCTVTLDEPIDDVDEASETVTIDDPDDEMLLIPLGSEDTDGPIEFRVGTSFTDTVDG